MSSVRVTVLTPAFNRADQLPKLYDSLTRQTAGILNGSSWTTAAPTAPGN